MRVARTIAPSPAKPSTAAGVGRSRVAGRKAKSPPRPSSQARVKDEKKASPLEVGS